MQISRQQNSASISGLRLKKFVQNLEFCHSLSNIAEIFSAFQVNMPKTFCCESGDLCLVATPDL